jgi:hypothetical protein
MPFSVDSTLKDLLADPRASDILRRFFPGRENDPQVDMVMYYTLRSIASFPEAGISPQTLQVLDEELGKL